MIFLKETEAQRDQFHLAGIKISYQFLNLSNPVLIQGYTLTPFQWTGIFV